MYAETTYQILFEHSADAMLVIDGEKFVDCNPAALNMLGYETREELFSTHPSDLSPEYQPDGRQSFEKANDMIATAMENGSHRFEWIHSCKDKSDIPIEVVLTRVPLAERDIIHVTWRDISEQFAMRAAILDQTQRLEVLLDQKNDALNQAREEVADISKNLRLLGEAVEQSAACVVITDCDGIIEYVNPAYAEVSGYCLEEAVGKNPNITNSGYHDAAFFKNMWATIRKGEIWSGTILNQRKNGEKYWVRSRISPVVDEEGRVEHFVGVETDINELIEEKEKAESANKAKSHFLSSMSHELRTPLNAILGFSQLLELSINKMEDATRKERSQMQIQTILSSGNHLLNLIDEVLDLARIESGKMTLSMEAVSLNTALDEIMQLASTLPAKFNPEVTIELDELAGEQTITTDPTRFRQILLNLVSNAVKYNREEGKVTLRVCEDIPGHCRLEVTDTGPGIPAIYQKDLFEPFKRLGAETTSIEGTGIGFSLTKHLVEMLGGQIGFRTQEGAGTTFWVSFPSVSVETTDVPARAKISASRPLENYDGKLVLYIEDNPINIQLLETFFDAYEGVSFVSAMDGKNGITIARHFTPDLIFLDVNLPDMSGIDVITELKGFQETRSIPVAALSANLSSDVMSSAYAAGAERYLAKPVNFDELVQFTNSQFSKQSTAYKLA